MVARCFLNQSKKIVPSRCEAINQLARFEARATVHDIGWYDKAVAFGYLHFLAVYGKNETPFINEC